MRFVSDALGDSWLDCDWVFDICERDHSLNPRQALHGGLVSFGFVYDFASVCWGRVCASATMMVVTLLLRICTSRLCLDTAHYSVWYVYVSHEVKEGFKCCSVYI